MKLGTLIYLEQNNKILMLYRNKKKNDYHNGLWVAPGGKLIPNETPYECAVRETLEETGFTVKRLTFKGNITFPDYGNSPFGDLWYIFVYYTTQFTGKIISSPEGELKWVEKNKIMQLNMWEGDKYFTPHILTQGKTFDCKLNYDGQNFIEHHTNFID